MKEKQGYVYIITNTYNTTLYVGVTSNLQRRIYEHKNKMFEGFSNTYKLNKLIYYEVFDNIENAIQREKQLKNWHRNWKVNLIISINPELKDLYEEILY
jgi:putative endonuclease